MTQTGLRALFVSAVLICAPLGAVALVGIGRHDAWARPVAAVALGLLCGALGGLALDILTSRLLLRSPRR